MKKIHIPGAVTALMLLGGCATRPVNLAAPTPITTLTQAARLTNLAEKAGNVAIDTGHPSKGTLTTAQALRAAVRAAMDDLYSEQAAGQALAFSTLTSALAEFNAFTATISASASTTAASN